MHSRQVDRAGLATRGSRRPLRELGLVAFSVALMACAGPNPVLPDSGPVEDYALLPELPMCFGDNDGEVGRDEVNFIAGLAAKYLVNPAGTQGKLDPVGQQVGGKLEWDFSSTSGRVMDYRVDGVNGQWFADEFPSGDLVVPTTASGDTLQVLQFDGDRVLLLGLASRKADVTLTHYEPPIVAMRFPLKKGAQFASEAVLREGSKVNGVPVFSKDRYEISIKEEGVLKLPNLKLHRVLLIETLVTIRSAGGTTTTTRQLQWFAECYGEVVRALSLPNEEERLFTSALEVRRLAI